MRWASLFGSLLATVALVFVGRRLAQHGPALVQFAESPKALLTLVLGTLGYGSSSLLLSTAWHRLVIWCGEGEFDPRTARSIFARSQLAKYVPGNIFHLAGRQVLGARHGLGHRALVASAMLEAWGLVTAALSITTVGILLTPERYLPASLGLPAGVLIAGLVVCLAMPWLLRFWPRLHASVRRRSGLIQTLDRIDLLRFARLDRVVALVPIVLRYLAFFSISGGLLAALTYAAKPSTSLSQLMVVGAFAAIAWIGGYLTPGAPAGLGIREVILATALTPVVGAAEAFAVTAAFRVVTTSGDLLFWGLGRLGTRQDATSKVKIPR